MIKENVKLVMNVKKFVTRICNECGKEERARMAVILKGREHTGSDIDLCMKCSCSKKYKPKSNWPKNEKSHLWKGGKRKSRGGIRIHLGPGSWIYEHRMVMGNFLGRRLNRSEVIHHINMDKFDNDIKNLYLCKNYEEHMLIHAFLEDIGYKMLNEKIWFDYNCKEYVLNKIIIPEEKKEDIVFETNFNIHIFLRKSKRGKSTSYYIYNEPDKENKGKYKKNYVHMKIAEKIIGRKLYRNEVVHHIDSNGLNNFNYNLVVMTNSKHMSCHRKLQKCVVSLIKKGYVKFDKGEYCVI